MFIAITHNTSYNKSLQVLKLHNRVFFIFHNVSSCIILNMLNLPLNQHNFSHKIFSFSEMLKGTHTPLRTHDICATHSIHYRKIQPPYDVLKPWYSLFWGGPHIKHCRPVHLVVVKLDNLTERVLNAAYWFQKTPPEMKTNKYSCLASCISPAGCL